MTDVEYLEWIAEHLVSFRPGMTAAHFQYLDLEGYEHNFTHQDNNSELDVPSLKLLKGGIGAIIKIEKEKSK